MLASREDSHWSDIYRREILYGPERASCDRQKSRGAFHHALPETAARCQNLLNTIAIHIGHSVDGVTPWALVGSYQSAVLEDCQAISAEIGSAWRTALSHLDQVSHLTSARLSEGPSGSRYQLGNDLAAFSRSLQCSLRWRLAHFAIRLILQVVREDRRDQIPLSFRCKRWHRIRLRSAEIKSSFSSAAKRNTQSPTPTAAGRIRI